MKTIQQTSTIPLRGPLLRGERRPRVALVGSLRAGKSTIFEAAASPAVHHERLAGLGGAYQVSTRFRWSTCRRSARCTI
jgi:ferrous iron transport protein B